MKILGLVCFLLFAPTVFAENFETFFSSGNYVKAIEVLNQSPDVQDKAYHLALCHSRLQEYDKAILFFQQAIEEKTNKENLYYEYGQALYAANELKKSREAFKTSAQNNFNPAASLYYVAHISQILEEYKAAYSTYKKIIKNYSSDIKIKQVAQFQLAETILMVLKEKSPASVNKYVLPLLKEAGKTDPSSTVATDIDRRYRELLVEYQLDPNLLSNGRRISERRWEASVTQRIKFDDNVTMSNFENNITETKKESFLFESEAFYKHTFVLDKKFLVAPEARLTFTHYGDRTTPDVFQNDSYILNLALKNKYEHKMFEKPSSLLFDLDFSKTGKDSNKIHKRESYSQSTSFILGETFSYFESGDSTIKFKIKDYKGTDKTINNYTYEMSINQILILSNQNLMILMMNANKVDNYNNSQMNTDSVFLRTDYLIPEIFPRHTLGLAAAITITDTKLQTDRGTETTLNPSIDLSRDINANTKFSLNYDFTDNNSKSSQYTYQKSVLSMEFKYVF